MTILCKGEKLTGAGDVTLKECGVEDGGVVNVVPKKKKTSVKKEKVAAVVEGDGKTGVGGGGGGGVGFAGMGDLIKGFTGGEEVEGIDDIMKQMASMQGTKDPVEMLGLMQKMLKSPAVKGYLEVRTRGNYRILLQHYN